MNITVRRLFGLLITVATLAYSFNIVTNVISGSYNSSMLIFAVLLVIIGLVGIGIALNFNGILNNQNPQKLKTPAKPAGPMVKVGGIVCLIIGGLDLIIDLSKIITPKPQIGEIIGNSVIPIFLIGLGVSLLKRK